MKKPTHGHSGRRGPDRKRTQLPSRTYMSWQSMRARVSGKHSNSRYYVGIKVASRWNCFNNFLADMGERPPGMSLDRIDYNGDYSPENCRWATWSQQSRNRRPHGRSDNRFISALGQSMTITEWSKKTGIRRTTISRRLDLGWSQEKAVTSAVRTRTTRKY